MDPIDVTDVDSLDDGVTEVNSLDVVEVKSLDDRIKEVADVTESDSLDSLALVIIDDGKKSEDFE